MDARRGAPDHDEDLVAKLRASGAHQSLASVFKEAVGKLKMSIEYVEEILAGEGGAGRQLYLESAMASDDDLYLLEAARRRALWALADPTPGDPRVADAFGVLDDIGTMLPTHFLCDQG
ncbi:hypothetical protein [Pseudomonas fluorescens]|uniref:Uncharacterized protein n=1 Tax=Pseudomonas fluorescens TaxID=294 RepID=A0AAE2PYX3_PSEFL|nr:hypothetical protein [Pseudomonas fluorescens]MBD8270645.1 hypothetical protein [Pseudomonas fluorescens]